METTIYHVNTDDVSRITKHAASVLKQGGLVVFPTETVYGIGANALDPDAASRIYNVKGRPSDNPLIVHIASKEDIGLYADISHPSIQPIINAFWPGPLTLVLPKKDCIPDAITGGLSTVAIRYPDNVIAQAIIKEAKLPICAPSANKSGTPSSTVFEHVYNDLNGLVDIIIDGGPSLVGLESTVLDLTSEIPVILRPGAITKSMMEAILQSEILASSDDTIDSGIPKAPGMKYKHYAPKGHVELLEGTHNQIRSFLTTIDLTDTGLIGSKELIETVAGLTTYNLGSITDINTIASNIFKALRSMDEQDISTIYIEAFEASELGIAIMNRLLKAANYNIRKLG
jgi:L-threonylcarbamoyladenylate synthase